MPPKKPKLSSRKKQQSTETNLSQNPGPSGNERMASSATTKAQSQLVGTSQSSSFGSSEGSSPLQSASSIGTIVSQGQSLPDSEISVESDMQLSPATASFFCERCKKTLKTKKGFLKHRALHIRNDCRYPNAAFDLRKKCEDAAAAIILQEMMLDPAVGPDGLERTAYISSLLSNTNNSYWPKFVSLVVDFILDIILQSSRVLPPKQHEANLKDMTKWLSSTAERAHLRDLLELVVKGSEKVRNIVVYRFCIKLFNFAEVEFVRLLKSKTNVSSTTIADVTMTKNEKETLYYCAGFVIRKFLQKGKKKDCSERATLRKKIVEDKFLFVEGDPYSDDFLKLKGWYDCLDRGGLVPVNESIFNFFHDVELIVRSNFMNKEMKYEWVVNELFKVENEHLLSFWHSVTSYIFGECESLLFLSSTVQRFVNFSSKAEAGLRMRKFQSEKEVATVALRTNLKRN